MHSPSETLIERLERASLTGDAFEDERLRAVVRARLLEQPSPQTTIDRFIVLGRLGAGGMGIVYAAYDPKLDRKVAIKLVRTSVTAGPRDRQERLLAEARALARVSHPNVVTVYEVGLHGEAVFVAMEFVLGKTLREHIVAGRTPWREAVRAYVEAGEGLAAVHAAGLVHRDFKPDNALVGEDLRVRVVDFGLASMGGEDGRVGEGSSSSPGPGTIDGSLVGTLAYMPPEQWLGLPVGPEGDQFSLCASLHEALCGTTPKITLDAVELALPPGLPARLRRALVRGLAVRRTDRFVDMRALVAELRASTESARRILVTAAVTAGVGAVLGVAFASALGDGDPCPNPVADLDGVWDSPRREQLRAVAASLGPSAPETLAVVEGQLDTGAEVWISARLDACQALYVRRTESQARFDRRMRCLNRSRTAVGDLVELLAGGDVATWGHAVEAVVGLPSAAMCSDPEQLDTSGRLPTDPETIERSDRLRAENDRAETLERLGRLDEALALAVSTRDAALALGHRATEAQAFRTLARLEAARFHDVEASAAFADAAWRAEAGRADELLVEILAGQLAAEAERGRLEIADALAQRVQGTLERIGGTPETRTQVLRAQYVLALARSRFDEAEAHARASLALRAEAGKPRSLDAARDLNNLGLVQYARADFAAAHASLGEALEIKREWLGLRHPDVILARINLAGVDEREGHSEVARAALESAIEDAEATVGTTPVLAMALGNLANLHLEAQRPGEAVPLAERALAVLESSVGPNDARLITPLNALGVAYGETGRTAEEQVCYERALVVADRIDPDHAEKAYAWNNLAALDRGRGDFAAAVEKSTKALALWERVHGAEHPVAGQLGFSLAQAELEFGAVSESVRHARAAIPILTRGGVVDAPSLAGAQFVLAQALWRLGPASTRAEVVDVARAAANTAASCSASALVAEIEAWLAARTSP